MCFLPIYLNLTTHNTYHISSDQLWSKHHHLRTAIRKSCGFKPCHFILHSVMQVNPHNPEKTVVSFSAHLAEFYTSPAVNKVQPLVQLHLGYRHRLRPLPASLATRFLTAADFLPIFSFSINAAKQIHTGMIWTTVDSVYFRVVFNTAMTLYCTISLLKWCLGTVLFLCLLDTGHD